ncbi:MAG TPA: hypothetical protein VFO34_15405 [Candidatus Acidoferrales bacterium]|nr:hypothetical protein [Candidatus Acidoferrales bacterium]
MIWHIFKKDVRLLWPLVVGAAALHFAHAAAEYSAWRSDGASVTANLTELLFVVSFIGLGSLIVIDVLQDALPGVRQDWLVRPIRRRDLLAAKLMFMVLLAQGPLFLADLGQALANGFPLSTSIAAAGSRAIFLLLGFSLPVFIISATLANLSEAVICGVALTVVPMGILMLITALNGGGPPNRNMPVLNSGEQWILDSARAIAVVLVGAVILRLQYFRRKTFASRVFIGVGTLVWVATFFIPWAPAFALEKKLSAVRGAADQVAITIDTKAGRVQVPAERVRAAKSRYGDEIFYLPVRVDHVSVDRTLVYDRTDPYLITSDGKSIALNHGSEISLTRRGPDGSEMSGYEGFMVPRDIYFREKDKPVRLEINHSLTLHELYAAYALPALDGAQRMPGVGACRTSLDEDGDEIELRCIQAGDEPSCASVFLENAKTGEQNPARGICNPEYAPYFGKFVYDDMSRFGASLRFNDPTGMMKFPVSGKQLSDARVVVRVLRPVEHFSRRIVLENIRMSDWEPLP